MARKLAAPRRVPLFEKGTKAFTFVEESAEIRAKVEALRASVRAHTFTLVLGGHGAGKTFCSVAAFPELRDGDGFMDGDDVVNRTGFISAHPSEVIVIDEWQKAGVLPGWEEAMREILRHKRVVACSWPCLLEPDDSHPAWAGLRVFVQEAQPHVLPFPYHSPQLVEGAVRQLTPRWSAAARSTLLEVTGANLRSFGCSTVGFASFDGTALHIPSDFIHFFFEALTHLPPSWLKTLWELSRGKSDLDPAALQGLLAYKVLDLGADALPVFRSVVQARILELFKSPEEMTPQNCWNKSSYYGRAATSLVRDLPAPVVVG